MTTELWYLFLSSVLLAAMWIPHIIGQVTNAGLLTAEDYRRLRDPRQFPDWVRRADRAHQNLVEQFGAFAGLIVVAQFAGIATATTALAAAVFFWARVAHAVVYIAGVPYVRAVAFVVSLGGLFDIARELFSAWSE